MKNIFLTILTAIAFISVSNAQLSEGKVTLEIKDATSSDEQMQMGLSMLKGSMTYIYFDQEQTLSEMQMMGGMVNTKNYVKTKTGDLNMLMDAMGSKIWVAGNVNDKKDEQKKMMKDAVVNYDKKDTKKILGYDAYKVNITIPNSENMNISGYITEDIKSNANVIQGAEGLNIKGFPLEFTVKSPKMTIRIEATEILDKIDKSVFNIVTEGYEKMTLDEFSKTFGAGGAGLGF